MNVEINFNGKESKLNVELGDVIESDIGRKCIVIKGSDEFFTNDVYNLLCLDSKEYFYVADLYFKKPVAIERIREVTKNILLKKDQYKITLEGI